MKIARILVYAAVLLLGLLLVQRVSSLDASTDDLVNQAGRFLPLLMLIVAGTITYQARIHGASQGLAFGIPLAIQAIIAFVLVGPGLGRAFLVLMLVPMVVVCGLLVTLVKPREKRAVPKPVQIPSPLPIVLPETAPTGNPPTGGWWRRWSPLQWGLILFAVGLTAYLFPIGMFVGQTRWAVLNLVLRYVQVFVVGVGFLVGLPLAMFGLLVQGELHFPGKHPNASQPTAGEPSPPSASLPPKPKTNILVGWCMLLLGLAGLAWFPYQIIERKARHGWFDYEEYTLQDNLRTMGPLVLLSLLFAIIGLGVIWRRRWANGITLFVGFVIILLVSIGLCFMT